MISALVCHWCMCLIAGPNMLGCQRCGDGSKSDLALEAMKLRTAGEMLTAECHPPNVAPEVKWHEKEGFFPPIGKKK